MPEGPLGWVLELAGLAPGPFAGMMFANHGAEVLRVDRVKAVSDKPRADVMDRGKHTIGLDLKSPDGVAAFKELTEQADVVAARATSRRRRSTSWCLHEEKARKPREAGVLA